MMQFKAFKPQALNKIAGAMGYQGDMSQFQQFIESDPQRKAQMDGYTNAARMMARGGVVNMQTGGFVPFGNLNTFAQNTNQNQLAVDDLNKKQRDQLAAFKANMQAQMDASNATFRDAIKERQALAANTVVDPRLAAEGQAALGPAPTQQQIFLDAQKQAGIDPSQPRDATKR
jgi:hypothetical protein